MSIREIVNSIFNKLQGTDFLSSVSSKQAIHIPNISQNFSLLFDSRDIEAFIRFSPQSRERIRLMLAGKAVNPQLYIKNNIADFELIEQLHKKGATIILNGINDCSNRLYYWTKFCEKWFQCKVHCNFYGTSPNSFGFNPHSDYHDVIVLQVSGSKQWNFYNAHEYTNSAKPYSKDEISFLKNFTLNTGDILYFPKGTIHDAKATTQPSGHITTGLTGFYWGDFLKESIDSASFMINEINQAIPIFSSDTQELNKTAISIIDKLKEHIKTQNGIEKYKAKYPFIGEFLNEIKLPDINLLHSINENTLFVLSDNPKPSITYETDYIAVNISYRTIPLKLDNRLKQAIDYVFSSDSFSANDLKALLNTKENMLLVYYLYNNGIIEPK